MSFIKKFNNFDQPVNENAGFDAKQYQGKTLKVREKPNNEITGYQNFVKEVGKSKMDKNNVYEYEPSTDPSQVLTKYEALAGKTFKVVEVIDGQPSYLKLQEVNGTTQCLYRFDALTLTPERFPFEVIG